MNILILTNGEYGDYLFCKERAFDYVICADRGLSHAKILGMTPDLIVGDFDSTEQEDLAYYQSCHIPMEQFDTCKDETDTEIAVTRAIEKGATKVTIWGGMGSRLDHTLGNVHLLYKLLKQGVQGILMNPYNTVYLVDKYIEIEGHKEDLVSLIPFAGLVKGITTKGLAYSLDNATLEVGTALGISNYLIEEQAKIWVEEGYLLVLKAFE